MEEEVFTEIEVNEENIKELEETYGAIPSELPTAPITHNEDEAIIEEV